MGLLANLFQQFEIPQVYTGGVPRSPKWKAFAADFKIRHPACYGCALVAKTNVPHHLKPFHEFPELELVEENLVMVCTDCHFIICHLRNFRLYNPNALEDLARYRERFLAAREGGKNLIGEPKGFQLDLSEFGGN